MNISDEMLWEIQNAVLGWDFPNTCDPDFDAIRHDCIACLERMKQSPKEVLLVDPVTLDYLPPSEVVRHLK